MAELNVDPMKRSSIYAIFGRYYGEKLYKLLFDCCDGFCKSVATCLGISPSGSATKVLNQQGDWINIETPEAQMYTTKVSLSSQDILNSNTAIEIIPAPGPNKFLQLISVTVRKNFYTTPYISPSNSYLEIFGAKITSGINLEFTSTEYDYNIPQDFLSYTVGLINNKSIDFRTGIVPTSGDGTLDIYISYQIIDL
jgi:hypothetical protein